MWQLRQAVMLSAVFLPLASYAAYTRVAGLQLLRNASAVTCSLGHHEDPHEIAPDQLAVGAVQRVAGGVDLRGEVFHDEHRAVRKGFARLAASSCRVDVDIAHLLRLGPLDRSEVLRPGLVIGG